MIQMTNTALQFLPGDLTVEGFMTKNPIDMEYVRNNLIDIIDVFKKKSLKIYNRFLNLPGGSIKMNPSYGVYSLLSYAFNSTLDFSRYIDNIECDDLYIKNIVKSLLFILVIANEDLARNHADYLTPDVLLRFCDLCNIEASFNFNRIADIDKKNHWFSPHTYVDIRFLYKKNVCHSVDLEVINSKLMTNNLIKLIESLVNIVLICEISNKNMDHKLFFVDKNENESHEKNHPISNRNRVNRDQSIHSGSSIDVNSNYLFGVTPEYNDKLFLIKINYMYVFMTLSEIDKFYNAPIDERICCSKVRELMNILGCSRVCFSGLFSLFGCYMCLSHEREL